MMPASVATPVERLIATAKATRGAQEVPPGSNAGPYVEPRLAAVGLKKGDPWCAAQFYDWGRETFGSAWPLPATGGCAVLGEFAEKKGILFDAPEEGDAFLVWHVFKDKAGKILEQRFGHVGLIVAPPQSPTVANTISGNTSGGGSREGWIVGERLWTFKPRDRFIRWRLLIS